MTAELEWGVRTSWRRYVLGLSDGRFDSRDGVVLESHSALFPLEDDADWHKGQGIMRFRGALESSGHFGMPLGHVIDPWLEFSGGSGQLTVVRWPGRDERIALADLVGDSLTEPLAATLTLEGTEVFGGVYQAGTELDPVVMRGM